MAEQVDRGGRTIGPASTCCCCGGGAMSASLKRLTFCGCASVSQFAFCSFVYVFCVGTSATKEKEIEQKKKKPILVKQETITCFPCLVSTRDVINELITE